MLCSFKTFVIKLYIYTVGLYNKCTAIIIWSTKS
nr:MAG TPA: hypothetical protein [Caudoviricetes sp.]